LLAPEAGICAASGFCIQEVVPERVSTPRILRDGVCDRLAYHVLRYVPDLVRDEWVNIGVLVFNPRTNERRLRLIEDEVEYTRIRRLHPSVDEAVLRNLRDDLEGRLGTEAAIPLEKILTKCNETLSVALQIAPQKGVLADDLDAQLERLYADHVAVPRAQDNQEPGPRFAGIARRSSGRPASGIA
jgi:hypothetical protein